jgi:MFS family permease
MRYIMGMSIMVSGSIGAVLLLSLEYLTKDLHVGAGQYGLVIAVLGLGIVMGGVLIQRLSHYLPTNRLVAAAIALNGLAMLGFVFRPTFSVVCIFTTLIGLSMVVARTVFGTLTQAIPPDELRGRVQAAFNLMTSVPLAIAVGMVGLLLQLVTLEVSFLPNGLTALPDGIRYHHVVSHHGVIFGAFAVAMLLTAWLTTNVLKGIDDAVFSAASRA